MVRLVTVLVFIVVILSFAQPFVLWSKTNELLDASRSIHGLASGTVGIYIMPSLSIDHNCPAEFNQSTSALDYTQNCSVELVNPNNASFGSLEFHYVPHGVVGLNFSINSSTGDISIWANQSGVGGRTVTLYVRDVSAGVNVAVHDYEFEVIDINDPPHLRQLIPSQSFADGSTLIAFALTTYFGDVDGDPLVFGVHGASNINVSINPLTSVVSFSSPSGFCSAEDIYFTATDITVLPPGNYTVDSNMVTVQSVCDAPSPPPAPDAGAAPPPRVCDPEWECERWSRCYENGTRVRRCVDLNACDPFNYERYFWEECEFIPDEDVEVDEEDEEVDEEVVPPERPRVEEPLLLEPEDDMFMRVLMVVAMFLAVIVLLYVLFRKELRRLYAKVSWVLTRKKRKEVLLSASEKSFFLGEIARLEKDFSLLKKEEFKTSDSFVQDLLKLGRSYISTALRLPFEFSAEDLDAKAGKVLVHDSLKSVFGLFFRKNLSWETKEAPVSRLSVSIVLEELRGLVLNTSKVSRKDYGFVVREVPVSGPAVVMVLSHLYNAVIALQFREVEAAKEKYLAIIGLYEELDEEYKSLVYDDVSRLYQSIRYVLACS